MYLFYLAKEGLNLTQGQDLQTNLGLGPVVDVGRVQLEVVALGAIGNHAKLAVV